MYNPFITVEYPLQVWQFVMLAPLISCLFLLMAGLVSTIVYGAGRVEIYGLPKWLTIPAALGILMFIGLPATLSFQYSFIVLMSALGAPTSSVVVMGIMVVSSWMLFLWATFGHIGRRVVK